MTVIEAQPKNRIERLFEAKSDGILSVFTTAGYPNLEDTIPVLEALQEAGVDMVELGMPFSDPLADGPVIQNSSMQAIENGMRLQVLFEQLEGFRQKIHLPIVLMGYVNTVMQYGIEQFCEKCKALEIDGVILPDLPHYEYETIYKPYFERAGLANVFLVSPSTTPERIRVLDQASKGFLYLVSSASTTGSDKAVTNTEAYLQRVKAMNLSSKTLVGFNIKDSESFQLACKYSNGAIIGSAFIKALGAHEGALKEKVVNFVAGIKK